MLKPVGYIGLIITKKYLYPKGLGNVTWLNPGDCLAVAIYDPSYARNDEHNRRSVDYAKQMANDGYVRYATDEEMKDADMVPTGVKHVYKYKEDDNATKA